MSASNIAKMQAIWNTASLPELFGQTMLSAGPQPEGVTQNSDKLSDWANAGLPEGVAQTGWTQSSKLPEGVAQVSDLLYRRPPACRAELTPAAQVSADALQIGNLRYSRPGGLRYPFGQILGKALNSTPLKRGVNESITPTQTFSCAQSGQVSPTEFFAL